MLETMLEEERQFFEESLASWLTIYASKVALVKGRELVGVYDTDSQALTEGVRRFQRQPFLIRPIVAVQPDIKVPALTLGIPMTDATTQLLDGRQLRHS
jgi:hypothetical protein